MREEDRDDKRGEEKERESKIKMQMFNMRMWMRE